MANTRFAVHEHAYDELSSIYETNCEEHFAHYEEVIAVINTIIPPNSKVLEVGSGTGRPASARFVQNGHNVTGIDFSQAMVDLASSQVPQAQFLKAEMTSYEPPSNVVGTYDLIVASQSMYLLSVAQTRTMLYKFARWVKMGGIVVVGTSYELESGAVKRVAIFDHRGWAEGETGEFLGQSFDHYTFGLEDAWCNLFKETGMKIIEVSKKVCSWQWKGIDHHELQYYVIGRKAVENPLLGPYPLPENVQAMNVNVNNLNAFATKRGRTNREGEIKAIVEALKSVGRSRVLAIGDGADVLEKSLGSISQDVHAIASDISAFTSLPLSLPSGEFDTLVALSTLHLQPFPEEFLETALRSISGAKNPTAIILQAAPDSEVINMMNDTLRSNPTTIQHHGFLLQRSETILKEEGFTDITFLHVDRVISFADIPEGEERNNTVAQVLLQIWGQDNASKEVKQQLIEALKVQFLFRPNGEIGNNGVILMARKENIRQHAS